MSNILILGGSGFIGSNLAEYLSEKGENIIVFNKSKNVKNLEPFKDRIKIINGDFRDFKKIRKIFDKEKIDIVIHLISNVIPGTEFDKVAADMDVELVTTMKLANYLAEKKIKLVFFSTGGAIYGNNTKTLYSENDTPNPINYYGWLKLSIEKYIEMQHEINGLEYMNIRPSNVYGKNQKQKGKQGLIAVTLGKIIRNEKIDVWGDGKITRDYLYVEDLCRAVYLLIKNNKWNETYNIGSGKGTSVNSVLKTIKNVTGKDFKINYTEKRKIDSKHNALNTAKLKKAIKWENLTTLEDGIKKTWETINN